MATAGLIGKRRQDAIERIQLTCAQLGGGKELVIPTRGKYGNDMLLVTQLEAIADFLEAINPPAAAGYDGMTVKELRAIAANQGLDATKARSKTELIAVIQAAETGA